MKHEHELICDEIVHLLNWASRNPESLEEIKKSMWSKLGLLVAQVELDQAREDLKSFQESMKKLAK